MTSSHASTPGHDDLHGQHAELFRLLSAAALALETGDTRDVLGPLTAFIDAILAHCADEETLMEKGLYPDRGRHRVAHDVFRADLRQLTQELQASGPTPQVGEWIRIRLPEWLRFHIAANDVPLEAFLARATDQPRSALGPPSTRAGRNSTALSSASTPSTASPSTRKGSRNSQTSG